MCWSVQLADIPVEILASLAARAAEQIEADLMALVISPSTKRINYHFLNVLLQDTLYCQEFLQMLMPSSSTLSVSLSEITQLVRLLLAAEPEQYLVEQSRMEMYNRVDPKRAIEAFEK